MPKLSNPDGPRIPRHGIADLVNQAKTVQVNHCRKPGCANYGAPPRTMPGRTGPTAERDPHYRLHSTNQGLVPALLCKACGESPPVKSNAAIAEEIARLIETDGLWTLGERTALQEPPMPQLRALRRPPLEGIHEAGAFGLGRPGLQVQVVPSHCRRLDGASACTRAIRNALPTCSRGWPTRPQRTASCAGLS